MNLIIPFPAFLVLIFFLANPPPLPHPFLQVKISTHKKAAQNHIAIQQYVQDYNTQLTPSLKFSLTEVYFLETVSCWHIL